MTTHQQQPPPTATRRQKRRPPLTYQEFLKTKIALAPQSGFEIAPSDVNPALKPHQADAVIWAVRGGRRGLFESFGLGKTVQELEFCRIVTEREGGRAIIVLPLGVRQEFVRDAALSLTDTAREKRESTPTKRDNTPPESGLTEAQVLEYLRKHMENKPLSVEELRALIGKPVWCAYHGWGVVGERKIAEEKSRLVIGFAHGWEWAEDVMKHAIHQFPPLES